MILDSPPYKTIPAPAPPALPARRTAFSDPTFSTQMVRLTDATDGTLCRISYGIWPAFSCDYTKILIQCDALFKIVVWNPSSMSGWGDIALPASFQGSDATWSHTDTDSIFHRDGSSRLMLLNVRTGVDAVVHNFAADFPDSPYLTRMSSSADDNVFCFARQTTTYAFAGFVVLTLSTRALYSEPPSRSTEYFKVQIDKSGRFMWNVALDPQSEWWDLTLPNTQQTVLTPGTGHAAVLTGLIAQYNNTTNTDTLGPFGLEQPLDKQTIAWPDWTLATEYSGTEADESHYAVTAADQWPPVAGPLHDELLQVATDGTGAVRRLCHMQNQLVSGDYNSIPQPACGYSGGWIAFHSSWGASGRRDVFLARTTMTPQLLGDYALNYLILYAVNVTGDVSVTIGGLTAEVTWSGPVTNGQYQLNVLVPSSIIGTGAVEVVLTAGGVVSAPLKTTV